MNQLVVMMALWIGFLILAIPYVSHARHPGTKPTGAYLIFAITFTVAAYVIFGTLQAALAAAERLDLFGEILGSIVILTLTFVPAFFLARWQIRKPQRKMPDVD